MVSKPGQKSQVWQSIEHASVQERFLQSLFEDWANSRAACLFGVPDWLSALGVAPLSRDERTRTASGYRFTPDIEFVAPPVHYVLELKHATKYEPLALAEVLHHAAWLRRHERRRASIVVPVIIASYNCWLRLAIDSLHRDLVRYYEADVLARPPSANDPTDRIVVFDAPLAPWKPSLAPGWLSELSENKELVWHEVAETGAWFGLRQAHQERPPIPTEPFVYVVRGANDLVVLWEGDPSRQGRYFLREPSWDNPGPSSEQDKPTWLVTNQ